MRNEIVLKFELRSGDTILPKGARLRVIRSNNYGARAADAAGEIHVIRAEDFDWA
jgi:hypothetical protein